MQITNDIDVSRKPNPYETTVEQFPSLPKTQWKIPTTTWTPKSAEDNAAETVATSVALSALDEPATCVPPTSIPATFTWAPAEMSPIHSYASRASTAADKIEIRDACVDTPDVKNQKVDDFNKRFTTIDQSPNVFREFYGDNMHNPWQCDRVLARGYPCLLHQIKTVSGADIISGLHFSESQNGKWTTALYYDGQILYSETNIADVGKIRGDEGIIICGKWTITWISRRGEIKVRSVRYNRGTKPLAFDYKS
jgi:hypothetical protein